jgi:DHA2 family multidrug resistance protein-like MFS transporter
VKGGSTTSIEVETRATSRAGRREWLALAVLALPTLQVSLDLFVVLLTLPSLSAASGASVTASQHFLNSHFWS